MDLSGLQHSASALVAMGGGPVTLTPPGGTYDVATSAFTGTGVAFQTTGAILPLSRGLTHMPDTDIQIGDMQLLLPGTIAQPAVDTRVVANGKSYIIIEVTPMFAGGISVYFDCIVRAPQ